MNTKDFILRANNVHNNFYNYDKVIYVKSVDKVIIICPIHGDFEQTPNNHINNKQKCPKCFGKIKYSNESFVEKCQEIHNNYYDYSLCNYVNNKCKVKIICPTHGIFEQKACHHLAGKGCMYCAASHRSLPKRHTNEIFIKNSKDIHGERYVYDNVNYIKNSEKVEIICSHHGTFLQTPLAHLSGQGCPQCNYRSKGNEYISNFLSSIHLDFKTEHKFIDCRNKNPLPFDFYIPSMNICIEYDGEQHFKPINFFGGEEKFKQCQLNDTIKNEYCKNNGINLIRIRYDEDHLKILKNLFGIK